MMDGKTGGFLILFGLDMIATALIVAKMGMTMSRELDRRAF